MEGNMQGPRFIITGGGTGGHIYPALSVAGALKGMFPDADFLFVGGEKGLEKDLIPREGYRFEALDIEGMERRLSISALVSAAKAVKSVFQAFRVVGSFKPHAVVGTGGYASFPVGAAAIFRKVPLILHEQNVYPGLANRLLGRFAKGIAISWQESLAGFGTGAEIVFTGNPIRSAIVGTTRQEAVLRLGFTGEVKTLLIFGGSQGAKKITKAAIEMMGLSKGNGMRIVLATGVANFKEAASAAREAGIDFAEEFAGDARQFYIVPYIHDMAAALSVSDICACRSGALTLAEITAKGLPSILIPHPYVPDDVQRKNALAMQEAGASVMIEDSALDGATLKTAAEELIKDPERLKRMAEAALGLSMPDAAMSVAELVARHMKGAEGRA